MPKRRKNNDTPIDKTTVDPVRAQNDDVDLSASDHMKKALLSFGEDDFFESSPFLDENELATKVEDREQTAEDSGEIEVAETADNADFNPITPQDLVPSSQAEEEQAPRDTDALEDNAPGRSKAARATITNAAAGFSDALAPLWGPVYDRVYYFGLQTFRYSKRFFVRIYALLLRPLRFMAAMLRIFVLGIDRLFFRSLHAVADEAAYLRKEMGAAAKYLRRAAKKDFFSVFSILGHYIRKALHAHKDMFRTAANFVLPVIALLVLAATVSYWNGVTFALKVTYNNKNIGYIQDESVYIKAKSLANERLGTVSDDNTEAGVELEKPTFSLALVTLNQLSDDTTICDNIIEYSESNITPACGIYIDGEFLCAVKNEADATGVFDAVLAPYRTDEEGVIAAFVEDVKFVQGFYADENNTVWDASRLAAKVNSKKKDAAYYIAKDGDTAWGIAQKYGLSEAQFNNLNPDAGKFIHVGDRYVVANEVNFIRVKLMKTEIRQVDTNFNTIKTENPALFRGDTRTIRKGIPGKIEVTELVTYIDGMRIEAKEIGRRTLSEPVDAKVQVGTKSTTVYSHSGSYNVSVSREGFVWPVPGCRTISSYYGYRSRGFHNGVDIIGPGARGKIIVAAKDGVVESVSYSRTGHGNYIIINHGGGIKTGYAHCLEGSMSVSPGQRVSAGQAIARVGSTGTSTGPHLHFEVFINGRRVDPLPYIR